MLTLLHGFVSDNQIWILVPRHLHQDVWRPYFKELRLRQTLTDIISKNLGILPKVPFFNQTSELQDGTNRVYIYIPCFSILQRFLPDEGPSLETSENYSSHFGTTQTFPIISIVHLKSAKHHYVHRKYLERKIVEEFQKNVKKFSLNPLLRNLNLILVAHSCTWSDKSFITWKVLRIFTIPTLFSSTHPAQTSILPNICAIFPQFIDISVGSYTVYTKHKSETYLFWISVTSNCQILIAVFLVDYFKKNTVMSKYKNRNNQRKQRKTNIFMQCLSSTFGETKPTVEQYSKCWTVKVTSNFLHSSRHLSFVLRN